MSSRPWGALVALVIAFPTSALAITPPQARCLATMERYGLQVVTAASRGALGCVRAAERGGIVPSDCFGAGVDGRLATTLRR